MENITSIKYLVFCVEKENATFEAALDWLCLNLDGNELPSKFSSGTSLHANEGILYCMCWTCEHFDGQVQVRYLSNAVSN